VRRGFGMSENAEHAAFFVEMVVEGVKRHKKCDEKTCVCS
jgi:hypothetical protein